MEKAKIIATAEKLDLIGILPEFSGKICYVLEKNKYVKGTCSKIVIETEEQIFSDIAIPPQKVKELLIFSKWLEFLK